MRFMFSFAKLQIKFSSFQCLVNEIEKNLEDMASAVILKLKLPSESFSVSSTVVE